MIDLFKSLFGKQIRQAYFQSREVLLGDHKRDIVVTSVDSACLSLKESRNEFVDALENFKGLIKLEDSPLEYRYQHLKKRYDLCRQKADQFSQRINTIEEVSEALFNEWENELALYNNRTLKAKSQQQLKKSRVQYGRLIKTFEVAKIRMEPVLADFQDQVLYLKHNLNANAIAALRHEFVEMGLDITKLIDVMEKTITEASEFAHLLSEQKKLPASGQRRLT